jgi:acyl dehydratase
MTSNGPFASGGAGLEPGSSFITSGRTITETDVVSFAALTGDWHPQHADASWAATSRFGQRVAHGMLVLSYAVGLVPLDPARVIALRGLDRVVFKRPALIGDTIHVEGRVEGIRPLDEATALATLSWKIVNQSGAAIARATVEAVVRRAALKDGQGNGRPGAGSRAAGKDRAPAASEPVEPGPREVFL